LSTLRRSTLKGGKLFLLSLVGFFSFTVSSAGACLQSKPKTPLTFEEEFLRAKSLVGSPKVTDEDKRVVPQKFPSQVLEEVVEKEEEVRETYRLNWYSFTDGIYASELNLRGGCKGKGWEITERSGVKLLWQISDSATLKGDFYVGVGKQNFKETTRSKAWISVRYLYLSYSLPFYGFSLSGGRLPVQEERGFWFSNYIDGIKLSYSSSILNGFLFAGKRLEDSRVSTSEERINLEGYEYVIGNLDYQYLYGHHLELFYLWEHRSSFEGTGIVSVWNDVKEKENLNWMGLRLKGKFEGKSSRHYWLDLAYRWGKEGSAEAMILGCTAYKAILSTSYRSVSGWGLEIGGKLFRENEGVGVRVAAAKEFSLPKLSTSREKLFGFNKVRSYGEVTNPDLNNLIILSTFGGYRLFPSAWLEVNLLKYLKYRSSEGVSFSRYFPPSKDGRDIGYEIDVMLDGTAGDKEDSWRYLLTLGLFIPGSAFEEKVYGFSLRLKRYW
jgi:alginate production protein